MLTITKGEYRQATLPELRKVPITEAQVGKITRTERWKGVQHGELVDTIYDVLKKDYKYGPINPTFSVSPTGSALVGSFELGEISLRGGTKPKDGDGGSGKFKPLRIKGFPQDTTQSFGFSHSNDSRKALTLYLGGRVLACLNGMVAVRFKSDKHKHTKGLYLRDWISESIGSLLERQKAMIGVSKMFAETKIKQSDHDRGLLELARRDVIPYRLIGNIDKDWASCHGRTLDGHELEYPFVPWVNQDDAAAALKASKDWDFSDSLWDWYNAVTHTAKLIPPAEQLDSLERSFDVSVSLLPSKVQTQIRKQLSLATAT